MAHLKTVKKFSILSSLMFTLALMGACAPTKENTQPSANNNAVDKTSKEFGEKKSILPGPSSEKEYGSFSKQMLKKYFKMEDVTLDADYSKILGPSITAVDFQVSRNAEENNKALFAVQFEGLDAPDLFDREYQNSEDKDFLDMKTRPVELQKNIVDVPSTAFEAKAKVTMMAHAMCFADCDYHLILLQARNIDSKSSSFKEVARILFLAKKSDNQETQIVWNSLVQDQKLISLEDYQTRRLQEKQAAQIAAEKAAKESNEGSAPVDPSKVSPAVAAEQNLKAEQTKDQPMQKDALSLCMENPFYSTGTDPSPCETEYTKLNGDSSTYLAAIENFCQDPKNSSYKAQCEKALEKAQADTASEDQTTELSDEERRFRRGVDR